MDWLVVVLLSVVVVVILYRLYKKLIKSSKNEISVINKNNKQLSQIKLDKDLFIKVNELIEVEQIDRNELVEITDTKLLSKINQCIPNIGQLVLNSQNLKNNAQMVKQVNDFNNKYAGKLYEAIIPSNAKLFDSKTINGAVRGGYLDVNKHTKQANFISVENLKTTNVNTAANLAANAMNVSSMIVGQYYMSQIDDKLESIKGDISVIKNFLDEERVSKIFQLIVNVSVIINHQEEISFNELITDKELEKLYDYEENAGNILTHINKNISNILNSGTSKDFNTYKINTNKLAKLLKEQEVLVKVMNQISSLKYILYHGTASQDYCYSRFNIALSQSENIKAQIKNFQDEEIKEINIDLEKGRYKKSYFLDNVFQPVIGKIDDNKNYINLEADLLKKIKEQSSDKPLESVNLNVYEDDTKLLIQDGKIYYKK